MQEVREQLERLFWGVIAPYDAGTPPRGTEPLGVATALTRALAVVYAREFAEVRAALGRVEAGLPDPDKYSNGQINVSEYNQRVMSVIRDERAALDRLEAQVQAILRETR